MNAPSKKIRVLIVDDSASVRETLSSIINANDDLEVMATASDPFVAAQRIQKEIPDVIILDVEMPRMDGITFLRKIMAQRPIPCVLCSSLLDEGSDALVQRAGGWRAGSDSKAAGRRQEVPHEVADSHLRRRARRRGRRVAQARRWRRARRPRS